MRTPLRDEEEVLLETHHHWLILMKPLVLSIGFLFLTFIGYYLELGDFSVFGGAAFCFICLLYYSFKLYERSVNIWVVTNLRVIDEKGVFSIIAKESPLDKIHNISYSQTVLGRLFKYGDISIQTAAGEGMTVHKFVNNPKLLKVTINKAKDLYLSSLRKDDEEDQEELLNAISASNQQKQRPQVYSQQQPQMQNVGSNTKECPDCAEVIKAKARKCRYCGYKYGQQQNTKNPVNNNKIPKEEIVQEADEKQEQLKETIIRMYQQTQLAIPQIANIIGVDADTVVQTLRNSGILSNINQHKQNQ